MCFNWTRDKRKFSYDTHHRQSATVTIAQELFFLDVGLFGDDPDDPGGGAGHHGRVLQGLSLLPPPLLHLQPALHTAANTK